MSSHVVILASPGPLGDATSVLGLLAVFGWITWRFGPALARLTGWCSWFVAWACGSQGGYVYCLAFALLGTVAWGAGTLWYARRRGHWPSALSARFFTRLLGSRTQTQRLAGAVLRRQRQ